MQFPTVDAFGIIPARAGFTRAAGGVTALPADHPRSRGVYLGMSRSLGEIMGSSPLARGLLPTRPLR